MAIGFSPGAATLSADRKRSVRKLATGLMFSDLADQVDYRVRLTNGKYRVVLRTPRSGASSRRRDAVAAALNAGEQHPIPVALEEATDLDSDAAELVVSRQNETP